MKYVRILHSRYLFQNSLCDQRRFFKMRGAFGLSQAQRWALELRWRESVYETEVAEFREVLGFYDASKLIWMPVETCSSVEISGLRNCPSGFSTGSRGTEKAELNSQCARSRLDIHVDSNGIRVQYFRAPRYLKGIASECTTTRGNIYR